MSAAIRKILEASPLGITLVGSRALGVNDPDADWDYVVSIQVHVMGFLNGLGFKEISQSDKYDHECVLSVWEFKQDGETVQVSVERHAKYKQRILEALGKSQVLRDMDRAARANKDDRDDFWRAMYKLAGFGRKDECFTCKTAHDDIEF